jgi:hypothetical protein
VSVRRENTLAGEGEVLAYEEAPMRRKDIGDDTLFLSSNPTTSFNFSEYRPDGLLENDL